MSSWSESYVCSRKRSKSRRCRATSGSPSSQPTLHTPAMVRVRHRKKENRPGNSGKKRAETWLRAGKLPPISISASQSGSPTLTDRREGRDGRTQQKGCVTLKGIFHLHNGFSILATSRCGDDFSLRERTARFCAPGGVRCTLARRRGVATPRPAAARLSVARGPRSRTSEAAGATSASFPSCCGVSSCSACGSARPVGRSRLPHASEACTTLCPTWSGSRGFGCFVCVLCGRER